MMSHTHRITRRSFLKSSVLVAGALNLAPGGVLGRNSQPGANDRLVVAHVGVGGMGMTHLTNMLRFQKEGKVRVAAICDGFQDGDIAAQLFHRIGQVHRRPDIGDLERACQPGLANCRG